VNGTDVLLYVNTGTQQSPSYAAVGSQRNMSVEETNESIDVSSKNSRARRVIAGRYESTLSLDALYVPSDAAFLALRTAMRAGDLILVQQYEEAVGTWQASANITSMSGEYPDQDAATIAIDLDIDGEWVELGT
jgi:TP901-1 family phage major tail protein